MESVTLFLLQIKGCEECQFNTGSRRSNLVPKKKRPCYFVSIAIFGSPKNEVMGLIRCLNVKRQGYAGCALTLS